MFDKLEFLIKNKDVENIDIKIYEAISKYAKNKNNYDTNISKIINKLIIDFKNDKLTIIDKYWLYKIIEENISIKDIENIIEKVKKDAKFFINNFIYVKNKFEKIDDIPDILKEYAIKDIIKFVMYEIQEEFLDAILNNKNVVAVKSRQTGGTTTAIAYLLWFAITNNNKDILILSKTDEDAKKTLAELKFMFNYLPFFLKKKIIRNNERLFSIGKETLATNIRSLTSGKNAGRSISASIVVIDEVEFIQNIEELYKSIVPTLSATNGKLILISTPYIYNSFFHRIIQNSEVNGFKVIWFYWWKIPYRDKKWYENECKKLNYDIKSIKTELNCEWIIPYKTFIDENILLEISKEPYKPIKSLIDDFGSEINIYEEFEENHFYLMSVDTKEYGYDYNSFVVFKIHEKDYYIVAEGRNKKSDFSFFNTLLNIILHYPNIKILFEKNRAFAYIEKFKEKKLNNYLIPSFKEIYNNKTNKNEIFIGNGFGLQTTKANRNLMLSYLSKYVNEKSKKIPIFLFEDLKELIIKDNGKIEGLNHDDMVMATSVGLYFINNFLIPYNLFDFLYSNKNKNSKSIIKILNDLNIFDKVNEYKNIFKYLEKMNINPNTLINNSDNISIDNNIDNNYDDYNEIIFNLIKKSISEQTGIDIFKDENNSNNDFIKKIIIL